MAIVVEPLELADLEAQWTAYNARSLVSHAGHFTVVRNAQVAFNRPEKPLHAVQVALLSSGGVYLTGTTPFDLESHGGDDSLRWIPGDVSTADLRFAHDHYDHSDCDVDPNCMFPIERLRELQAQGVIGRVAPSHAGLMGFIPNPSRLVDETAPALISRMREEGTEAVVLSPG